MNLTTEEEQFLQVLACGSNLFVDPGAIRIEEMKQLCLVQEMGPRPFDVVITEKGVKLIETIVRKT